MIAPLLIEVMAEALRDKILPKKQGVSQTGRQLLESSDIQNDPA
jgi:hypothetical protein